MADITFEIRQKLAVLSDRGKGWKKEINLVSWNDGAPKVDIREWNEDHTSMKRGITFSRSEFLILADAIKKIKVTDIADYPRSSFDKNTEAREKITEKLPELLKNASGL